MSATGLRPWTEQVRLHPDVESGALRSDTFAIDLGSIAERDPGVPAVYRDAASFFRATYLTADLRRLLDEVLASLAGHGGHSRVLKLRTPFGGGKSHTLATLLHAARDRAALDLLPEGQAFARPADVRVAVFDGEKFDGLQGRTIPDGPRIQTMWGWLAWGIGRERAFALVADHDRDRVAPGGDVVRRLLTEGADGRPVLILLDEVLKYLERASGVAVHSSTLDRQAKDFFQNLTVEVAGSASAVLVYTLTWSSREALGNVALLQEIDHLAARVDQLREPVAGDEILPVLQRRLLDGAPAPAIAAEVANAYADSVAGVRRAAAETPAERQAAEDEIVHQRERLRAAYPFHPALIDVLRERWSAVDSFQRTRGALRFLAACLHGLKERGGARALLGPGDIPLRDPDARLRMLNELGVQNTYDPVITADIEGPAARARRVDDRLAAEVPALATVRPAARLATAILAYSFGGLRRDGGANDLLPPGVGETELLASVVGPDLDYLTARAVLADLRNTCLYLHHDGVRYCFRTDPNVTMLVEDAESDVTREDTATPGAGPVARRVRDLLEARLGGKPAIVWPARSQDIPDQDPRFVVAYLSLEFARESAARQDEQARQLFSRYGDRPRRYRNGLGLAVPDRSQVEAIRRAVRYLLAVERVEARRAQLRLTNDQMSQLRERRRTEEAAAESSLRDLYGAVWLPRVETGELAAERIERGGRPLQATGIHERIMELLTGLGIPRVHASITPRKLVERLGLGEPDGGDGAPRLGVSASDVRDTFYEALDSPRLESDAALRKAIARGVAEGTVAYATGPRPALGPDGRYQVALDRVVLGHPLAEDEVDLDSGFVMLPSAVPSPPAAPPGAVSADGGPSPVSPVAPMPDATPIAPPPALSGSRHRLDLVFEATRTQVFKAFPAIANLAEKSDAGKVVIRVEGTSQLGYDPTWLRNAVEEPLDEADIIRRSEDIQRS